MEEKFKQFLKKQMEKEAEQIEKEVLSNESLKEVQAPDTLREALAKSIKEYEKNRTDAPSEESEEIGISIEEFCEKLSKEDRESYFRWRAAEEKKKAKKARKRFHFPRKKRAVFVVAATMVLVLGIGMTSLGGRPYWLKVVDLVLGNENTVTVDTEGEDRILTTDVSEKEAYEQIKEELGIEPVQLQYMPAGMEFYDSVIEKGLGTAKIYYLYKAQVIQYEMYLQNADNAYSVAQEDKSKLSYKIENGDMQITVKELEIAEGNKSEFLAMFQDRKIMYRLIGIMEREEFEKILKNFLNQEHIAYGSQSNAGQRISFPQVYCRHNSHRDQLRQSVGPGKRRDIFKAVNYQHSHNGRRERGAQITHQFWYLTFSAKEQKGQPPGDLGAEGAD